MRARGRGPRRDLPRALTTSAIPTQGVSESSRSTLAAAAKHWDAMRLSNPECSVLFPKPWSEIEVATATSMDTYARYAFYLFNYKKNTVGDTLDASSIINYTSALLNDAKNRFIHEAGVSVATTKFFECLIPNSTSDIAKQWGRLKGVSLAGIASRAPSRSAQHYCCCCSQRTCDGLLCSVL